MAVCCDGARNCRHNVVGRLMGNYFSSCSWLFAPFKGRIVPGAWKRPEKINSEHFSDAINHVEVKLAQRTDKG